MGLEPTTFSLATRRSTTELCPQFYADYRVNFYKFYNFSNLLKKSENCVYFKFRFIDLSYMG